MKKTKAILIIFILINVILFAGCTEQNDDENSKELKKFVGIWRSEDRLSAYVFYSKGNFTFDSQDAEFEGTYEVKTELLWFTYTYPPDLEGEVESFNYNFSNDDTTFSISPYDHPEYLAVFYKN